MMTTMTTGQPTMSETGPRVVSFTVAGLPAPQGSKRAFVNYRTGKPVVLEMAGAKLSDWRSAVRDAAVGVMLGMAPGAARVPLTGPLSVSLAFTLPKPKSAPKTRRTYPDKRPDLDKLVRAVLDGLTGPLFADDAQVILLTAGKLYPGEGFVALPHPGVMVTVKQIGDYGAPETVLAVKQIGDWGD
jgi:Holliday junction resolvase RusA-like endonuclease